MTGILWLASYPKSGNTWLRAFLANYFRGGCEALSINDLPNDALGDNFLVHYEYLLGRPKERISDEDAFEVRADVHR